jgi:hypothetical protein
MKAFNQRPKKILIIVLLFATIISCASIPELKVHYQLQPCSDVLKGKRVFLAIKDDRPTRDIIGPGAKKDFANFPGNITFSFAAYDKPGFKLGPYTPLAMTKEAFKRRLENLGLEVLSQPSTGDPQLLIVLEQFLLDLQGHEWVAEIGYQASLMKGGRVLSEQSVSGRGERLKLVGRSQANAVLSGIFTDLVNRLDVLRLYRQAGL